MLAELKAEAAGWCRLLDATFASRANRGLLWTSLVALALALCSSASSSRRGFTFEMGYPGPWLTYEESRSETGTDFDHRYRATALSWSGLIGVLGFCAHSCRRFLLRSRGVQTTPRERLIVAAMAGAIIAAAAAIAIAGFVMRHGGPGDTTRENSVTATFFTPGRFGSSGDYSA